MNLLQQFMSSTDTRAAGTKPLSDAELLAAFMAEAERRNAHEPEFLQAVKEVAEVVIPFTARHPKYRALKVLERIIEPERSISFRVVWTDDAGEVRVNRGYRFEFNSALGPYKGGLRFHPSVNASILKFLGFEQTFKNALTTLPLGGGKGGADFDPKGKSDAEVMRFCQAFMTELARHIGPNTDVPAGDIGVGGREIGFLFGQYKRLRNEFTGVLTGKKPGWGGSAMRPEATGYGATYFLQEMLALHGRELSGLAVAISGSGNVAIYAAQKCAQLGARVVSLSDSSGTVSAPAGLSAEQLSYAQDLKEVRRGRIAELVGAFEGLLFMPGQKPWGLACDVAFPCATQNEIELADARALVGSGCKAVVEAANMPCTPEAVAVFQGAGVLFAPAKAANAGGVATSGLEMSQNSLRLQWTAAEVDERLHAIMRSIHEACVSYGREEGAEGGAVDYVRGANLAAFTKVADAMIDQGLV
jgi:glutamate dehydrogenase (NADP+)